eukprot:2034850-Rhodomonas_salina.1
MHTAKLELEATEVPVPLRQTRASESSCGKVQSLTTNKCGDVTDRCLQDKICYCKRTKTPAKIRENPYAHR